MSSFWERSWKKTDLSRVAEYVDTFNMEADDLIVFYHEMF